MKLKLDLDEIYARVEPWEFTLNLDGKERRVRRLTPVDMATFQSLKGREPEEVDAFYCNLFEDDDRPNVSGWDQAKVTLVTQAIVAAYEVLVLKKKCQQVRSQVEAASGPSTGKT